MEGRLSRVHGTSDRVSGRVETLFLFRDKRAQRAQINSANDGMFRAHGLNDSRSFRSKSLFSLLSNSSQIIMSARSTLTWTYKLSSAISYILHTLDIHFHLAFYYCFKAAVCLSKMIVNFVNHQRKWKLCAHISNSICSSRSRVSCRD